MYAGLPLAFSLQERGVRVRLANLSFSRLELLDLDMLTGADLAAITSTVSPGWMSASRNVRSQPGSPPTTCLPACTRSRKWVSSRCVPPTTAWRSISISIAVVLVDGGTDILCAASVSASTPTTASTMSKCWRTSPPSTVTAPTSARCPSRTRAGKPRCTATPSPMPRPLRRRPSIVNGQIAAATSGASATCSSPGAPRQRTVRQPADGHLLHRRPRHARRTIACTWTGSRTPSACARSGAASRSSATRSRLASPARTPTERQGIRGHHVQRIHHRTLVHVDGGHRLV